MDCVGVLRDFSGYNIDVACCLLESCGRYLYQMKHTYSKLSHLMDTMMRIKKARVGLCFEFMPCFHPIWSRLNRFSCLYPLFLLDGVES